MEEDVCAEYRSSLMDLTCNSKPLISMLTMLAEDNLENAKEIVKVIETQLHEVQPEIKLPILYLIDSIVKNIGGQYLTLFTQSIVSNFCSVFEKGDEKTRMQLFKLRQTWNNIFPMKKLFAIDTRVNAIDPAWPITAMPYQKNIHVNPKFFENKQQQQSTTPSTESDAKKQELQAEVRQQLWAKQQELLKLQQQKLELELIQAKAKLEEQSRLLNIREKEDPNNQRFQNQIPHQPVSNFDLMASGLKNDIKHLVQPVIPQRFSNAVSSSSTSIPIHSIDPRISSRDPRISSRDPRLNRSASTAISIPGGVQKPLCTTASFAKRSESASVTLNSSASNTPTNCSVPLSSGIALSSSTQQINEPIASDSLLPPSSVFKSIDRLTNKTGFSITAQKTEVPTSQSGQKIVSFHHSSSDSSTSALTKQMVNSEICKQSSPVRKRKPEDDLQCVKTSSDSPKKSSSPKKTSPSKRSEIKKTKNLEQSKLAETKPSKGKKDITSKNINKSPSKEKEKVDVVSVQSTEHKSRKGRTLDKGSKNNWDSSPDAKHENFNICSRVTRSQLKATKSEETLRERSRSPIKKSDRYSKKLDETRANCQEFVVKAKNKTKISVSELNKENKKAEPSSPKEFSDRITRDVDLRVSPETPESPSQSDEHSLSSKRDLNSEYADLKDENTKENIDDEPPSKKVKDDDEKKMDILFGIQDQDYRQLSQRAEAESFKNGNHKGWAQFKQIHPDEFKSPLRPSRENVVALTTKRTEEYGHVFGFQRIRGRDSLGRPLLSQMRNERNYRRRFDRYSGNFNRYGREHQQMRAQMELMLANEKEILRQAEQQLLSGRMTTEEYNELRTQLDSLYDRQRMQALQMNFGRHIDPYRYHDNQFDNSSERTNFLLTGNECSGTDNKQDDNNEQVSTTDLVADPKNLPPTRSIMIDKQLRKIHFVGHTGIIMMENDDPREISFKGTAKKVYINDMDPVNLNFGGETKEFVLNGKKHSLKFGAPSRELYIDNHPYEIRFGGQPIKVKLDGGIHTIYLEGPPPNVQIGEESRKDLLNEIKASLSGDNPTTSSTVDRQSSTLKSELLDKEACKKEATPISALLPKDTDLRPDIQNKDLIRDQDQDLRVKETESFKEQMTHDVDMRSSTENDEANSDLNSSAHHRDLADVEGTEIKEELPLSGLQDVDWRPVLHSAETNSPSRSPAARGSPLLNQTNVNSHLPVKEQKYSEPSHEAQRRENSPVKRINERYQNTVQSQFRNSPPYWNKEREERQWDNSGRTEVSTGSLVRQSEREITGNVHSTKWEQQENQGQWEWEESNRYSGQINERPPEVRDSRWPDYLPPSSLPNQGVGPRREEPPPPPHPPLSLPLPLPPPPHNAPPPHNVCPPPPPGKHFPREPWPPQAQRGRNQRWHERRKESDNWEWREDFQPGPRTVPYRPSWNSPTHHNEEYPSYFREGVPRPPPPQQQPPPPPPQPPMSQNHMPFHNPVRYPPRGPAPRRHPCALGPRRHMDHNTRLSLRGRQENFPRPVPVGTMDTCPPSIPRGSFSQPPPALPPDASMSSYQPHFPLTEQRFVSPAQQDLPYDPTVSSAPMQLPGTPAHPAPEVSNPPPVYPMPSIDINTLFEKLVAAGIIAEPKSSNPEESETQNKSEDKNKAAEVADEEKIPPLSFSNMETLKTRYNGVINGLYRGTQCASCGLRFTQGQQDRYSQHLDWHFRVNRREKDGARKAFSRKWFYDVEDWIQFEEIEDLEERARSFFELQADEEQFQVADPVEVPSVTASENESENFCVVCGEHLKQFWVEEEEEWHLKDAVRIDNQTYHPLCYEDFKKASEAPETPVDASGSDPLSTSKKEELLKDDKIVKEEPPSESAENDDKSEEKTNESVSEELTKDDAVSKESDTDTSAKEIKIEIKEEPIEVNEQMTEENLVKEENDSVSTSDLCAMVESATIEEEEARPESKMVVLKSGGIVMKVRADSIAMPASPASAPKTVPAESGDLDEIEEMEYPPPDPRFQVMPPVQRGTELSGLCTIM